mmetsp:Transcript_16448/g.35763  ORF Transcript_16448/g.35763 Transcript_16448/m.35763 type:complete len:475 (-) Transcript_16448:2069-3493(-)
MGVLRVETMLLSNGASASSAAAMVTKGTRAGLLRGDATSVRSRERVRTIAPVCSGEPRSGDDSTRRARRKTGGSLRAAFPSSLGRGALSASRTSGSPPPRTVRCNVLSCGGQDEAVVPSSVINIPHLEDVDLHVVNSRSPHRLGLIVDPERDNLPFSFSVEILEPNFTTMMDVNPGFQLFYVLKGSGQAFCMDSQGHAREHTVRFGVGDSLLFPPKRLHGIISTDEPLTLLGLMLHAPGIGHTAKEFVQWVQESPPAGKLTEEELTALYKDFQRSYQKDESAAAEAPAAAAAAAAICWISCAALPKSRLGEEVRRGEETKAERSEWPRPGVCSLGLAQAAASSACPAEGGRGEHPSRGDPGRSPPARWAPLLMRSIASSCMGLSAGPAGWGPAPGAPGGPRSAIRSSSACFRAASDRSRHCVRCTTWACRATTSTGPQGMPGRGPQPAPISARRSSSMSRRAARRCSTSRARAA